VRRSRRYWIGDSRPPSSAPLLRRLKPTSDVGAIFRRDDPVLSAAPTVPFAAASAEELLELRVRVTPILQKVFGGFSIFL
jgi:hypothetical protein